MVEDAHAKQGESLFFALAEDLKTPLLRIAYQAENLEAIAIQTTALNTLKMLDAYLLGAQSQTHFELEPINPSAVLMDVAHELSAHAKSFDCELRLTMPSHHTTALVHRQALLSALTAIGTVFIESQAVTGKKKTIEMASYRTRHGVTVGVFQGGEAALNAQLLAKARAHLGAASRPFAGLASGAAAQLFIAEQLLGGMQTALRAAKRGTFAGLAADFLPSSQLRLV